MLVKDTMRKVFLPCAALFLVLLVTLYNYHPDQPIAVSDEQESQQTPQQEIQPSTSAIPDFSRFTSVHEKKRAFFAFLLPMVERENQRLALSRQRLLSVQQLLQTQSLSESDNKWLVVMAKKYRLNVEQYSQQQLLVQLLNRVDVIPPSLALSQSANESAWGTSRFALQANNLFGQWCFRKGCGVIPKQRPKGATYEVASFPTPEDSVVSYIHNLNTNSAYSYLRELRASLRKNQLVLSGDVLAEGLMSYSARGEAYIDELRQMIRVNGLARYDQS